MVVIALRAELLRIGVNINQIARALNVAMIEGSVLNLQISALEHSAPIRFHIQLSTSQFGTSD